MRFTVMISNKDGGGEIPLADTADGDVAGDLAKWLCKAASGHSFRLEITVDDAAGGDGPHPEPEPETTPEPAPEPPQQARPPLAGAAGRTARPPQGAGPAARTAPPHR